MRSCLLAVLALSLSPGCRRGQPQEPSNSDEPSFRIAIVTDLQGYLEPCGCTSDPLGGIDRLAAQIRALRDTPVPLILLTAGDLFFDTAVVDAVRVDQANRNATTLARILNRLSVAAILPGHSDRAQPKEVLDALREASSFPWLGVDRDVDVLRVTAGVSRVGVIGVRPGADRDAITAAVRTAAPDTDVIIALIDGSRRDATRVGAIDGVDFVIQGGLDEDDAMAPHQAGKAWVLHAGRQGQGLTVVEVYRGDSGAPFTDGSEWSRTERVGRLDRQIGDLSAKIAAWEDLGDVNPTDLAAQRDHLAELRRKRKAIAAPASRVGGNTLSARWIPLTKQVPRDEQVETLMREHDKIVNDANRVAFADLKPPALGPDDIAYVGSAACSACHHAAFSWWRNHAHGVAYLTLQQRNKEYNLDCVGCHVTGYGEPGGSTVTHNLGGALVNVGCESCHGPGAAHSKEPKAHVVRNPPESTCLRCHNDQHSDLFDYDAYRKTLIVPGHGLPPAIR